MTQNTPKQHGRSASAQNSDKLACLMCVRLRDERRVIVVVADVVGVVDVVIVGVIVVACWYMLV